MLLLTILLVCHYVADFVLTTPGMIAAKAEGKPLLPIAGHAAVHAALMLPCLMAAGVSVFVCAQLGALEWCSHLAIDTAKGRLMSRHPKLANAQHKAYWQLFGFDQLLHVLVIVAICKMAI